MLHFLLCVEFKNIPLHITLFANEEPEDATGQPADTTHHRIG